MGEKLTKAQYLHLTCIDDWQTPQEVAAMLGFWKSSSTGGVARVLSRLAQQGLAEWRPATSTQPNCTYRITPAGRSQLSGEKK